MDERNEHTGIMTPLPAQRRSRIDAWVSIGIPQDSEAARERLIKFRELRAARQARASLTASVTVHVNEALDSIATRYGVSRSWMVRKFIRDGLSRYGDESEQDAVCRTTEEDGEIEDAMLQTCHDRLDVYVEQGYYPG